MYKVTIDQEAPIENVKDWYTHGGILYLTFQDMSTRLIGIVHSDVLCEVVE